MAQNIFNIGDQEEKILGIVKAQYGLKNKNQAMHLILKAYGENFLEPEIRPEYLKKLEKIRKEGYGKTFSSVGELRKHLEKDA